MGRARRSFNGPLLTINTTPIPKNNLNNPTTEYLTTHLSRLYGNFDFTSGLKRAYHQANILPHIDNSAKLTICEIGPGFGEMLSLLTERKNINLIAVDNSDEVIRHIQTKFPPVKCFLSDNLADFFDQHADQFNYVIMIDVLEHLGKESIIPILQNIKKSLKSGGKIIIQTLNGAGPLATNILYSDFTHTWAPSELSVEQVLKLSGFQNMQITGYRFPEGVLGFLRGFIRIFLHAIYQSVALLNGTLRMKILDPNIIAVAVKE